MPTGKKTVNNGVKCTNEEKARRIEEAALWILENPDAGYTDFMNAFCPRWGIQRSTANRYRKEAMTQIGSAASSDVESAKRIALASMSRMLKMAMDAGDVKLAFNIRQEINKVSGAHAPVRTEVVEKKDHAIFQIEAPLKKVD